MVNITALINGKTNADFLSGVSWVDSSMVEHYISLITDFARSIPHHSKP